MEFNAYDFKNSVKASLPYADQWTDDYNSPKAKLIEAIGHAIASQLRTMNADTIHVAAIQEITRTANEAVAHVQSVYSTDFAALFEEERKKALEISDEVKRRLFGEFTNELKAHEEKLKEDLRVEREAFELRFKRLRDSFMEELRALK